jgi:uncharacterized protein YlxW (UPF0749 family)
MSKKRQTVTLDEANREYLQQDDINASGLVNQLVTKYRRAEDGMGVAEQVRLDRLKDKRRNLREDIRDLQDRITTVDAEIEQIETTQEQRRERQASELESLAEKTPVNELASSGHYTPLSDEQLQQRADEAGVAVDEFLATVEDVHDLEEGALQ